MSKSVFFAVVAVAVAVAAECRPPHLGIQIWSAGRVERVIRGTFESEFPTHT